MRIAALVAVMLRWPNCPQGLVTVKDAIIDMKDPAEFRQLMGAAINFYFRTFTARFSRLPIVPVEPPLFRG